jgi:hypothetical protein
MGVALASPSSARAEDPDKTAALVAAGSEAAQQGDRRAAIHWYQEAYAAAPRRAHLCVIGLHYEALARDGDVRDACLAVFHYEGCLAGEGQTPTRADIEARIARLSSMPATVQAYPPPRRLPPPLPSPPPDASGPQRTHSRKLAAGGIVMAVLGAVQMVVGFGLLTQLTDYNFGYGLAAAPLIVNGAGCIAGGVPMAVVGDRTIPVSTLAPLVLPALSTSQRGPAAPMGLALVGTF